MTESCALDVAERGAMTLVEVGAALNITRERARQIEDVATRKLRLTERLRDWRAE
jgi:DNA-directed RNA polymerase sigma subunit (sigma70/sigma32)